MHGQTVEGPIVSDEAYAAYARGAYLEAHGQRMAAIDAYRAALAADGGGAAIWTRLGVLYCAERPADAEHAFEEAIALAPAYASAWSSRAECRKGRGLLADALSDALRAVALEPDDTAANLLVANLYQQQRRLHEAKAWLLALVLRSPDASAHWLALASVAEVASDAGLARHARTQLAQLQARRERAAAPASSPSSTASSDLVGSQGEQDLMRARALAANQHVDARTLALLAATHGQPAVAMLQAKLVLAADPSDPDALLAALAAALTTGDSEQLAELLAHAQAERRPGSLGARLLGDLLLWLVGEDAARAWKTAYGARALP